MPPHIHPSPDELGYIWDRLWEPRKQNHVICGRLFLKPIWSHSSSLSLALSSQNLVCHRTFKKMGHDKKYAEPVRVRTRSVLQDGNGGLLAITQSNFCLCWVGRGFLTWVGKASNPLLFYKRVQAHTWAPYFFFLSVFGHFLCFLPFVLVLAFKLLFFAFMMVFLIFASLLLTFVLLLPFGLFFCAIVLFRYLFLHTIVMFPFAVLLLVFALLLCPRFVLLELVLPPFVTFCKVWAFLGDNRQQFFTRFLFVFFVLTFVFF